MKRMLPAYSAKRAGAWSTRLALRKECPLSWEHSQRHWEAWAPFLPAVRSCAIISSTKLAGLFLPLVCRRQCLRQTSKRWTWPLRPIHSAYGWLRTHNRYAKPSKTRARPLEKGNARLRIALSSDHTDEHVAHLCEELAHAR